MSEIYHSSFPNENDENDDKDSLGKLPTGESSRFSGNCIAISPDSKKIVTFSREKLELKLYNIEESGLIKPDSEFTYNVDYFNHPCWSMAISNCVDENDRLIALSGFDAKELKIRGDDLNSNNKENSDNKDKKHDLDSSNKDNKHNVNSGNKYKKRDLESGNKYNKHKHDGDTVTVNIQDPQTWVISTIEKTEIDTFESVGGVIRFLDSDYSNSNGNNNGGDDSPLKDKTVIIIVNASGIFKETIKKKKGKNGFFSRSSKVKQSEQIELPKSLSNNIKNNDRQQIIEMYSLITGDLEMLFKRHESLVVPNITRSSPIFAISQNEKILAFCRETSRITLYSTENGLEITTKQLKVWDLFTTFENSIRQIDCSETLPLKMNVTHRLMNPPGKMFAVRNNGEIFSLLDPDGDVDSIRKPSNPSDNKMIQFIPPDHTKNARVIYTKYGKECEKNEIIIYNVEPWHSNKEYSRKSVFLDSAKSTQLIISQNTIQVWKDRNRNNNMEKRDKSDRVLEYIWARKKVIGDRVQDLRIGEREFVLEFFSKPSTESKSMTIHWPNNVNVLEAANDFCKKVSCSRANSKKIQGITN
ncbi:hypothetical protein Glove_139g298 [Diversispora epigaea]|uniref:Uncharacterized protein n=1 Tax=Diversispora epigaea TaxID=1348612 RepID=A0A397J420_9GLOM|nr:hypothetical protein Glove_139g298 [Diversispora epigaea]